MALTGFTLNEIIKQHQRRICRWRNRRCATWLSVYPLFSIWGFKANESLLSSILVALFCCWVQVSMGGVTVVQLTEHFKRCIYIYLYIDTTYYCHGVWFYVCFFGLPTLYSVQWRVCPIVSLFIFNSAHYRHRKIKRYLVCLLGLCWRLALSVYAH